MAEDDNHKRGMTLHECADAEGREGFDLSGEIGSQQVASVLVELKDHKVPGQSVDVDVFKNTDEPHRYLIAGKDKHDNPLQFDVPFQNGVVPEVGLNGVTMEALLVIIEDRLLGFQAGAHKCKENQEALDHVHVALYWLKTRTASRIEAGIEGTHEPMPDPVIGG